MTPHPRAAIIGPGAVGLVLARSLERSGASVTLVGRSLPPPPPRRDYDAVFLCVKSPGLRWAVAQARRLAGPETALVSLLNGVTQVRPMLAAFGPARAVFGVCNFPAIRTGAGRARGLGGRKISLAAERRNRAAASRAEELLARAGWDCRLEPDRDAMLWNKLVFNAAVNPVTALACASYGETAADPALLELVEGSLREAVAAAKAAGVALSGAAMLKRTLGSLAAFPGHRSSMLQDLDAGRKTEVEEILGPLLRAARGAGLPCPILQSLYRMVLRLQAELRGTRRRAEAS